MWQGRVGFGLSLGALGAALAGCGEDGGRASASESQGVSASEGSSQGTDNPTGPPTGSASDSDAGSASNSATQTTPGTASDSSTAAITGDTSTGTTAANNSSSGPGTDSTAAGTDGETTMGLPACDGDDQGGFDFSYLWVANTDQGSISKVNTETKIEEARYFSDLTQNGNSSPSRTSVNITGRFVVVSNRNTGWVTKVAANNDDCVDKNANGVIDTSLDKDSILPWGSDECVLWSTQVTNNIFSGGAGPRATAWTPGEFNEQTCKYENQKVWIGWLTGPGQAVMGQLDGETGALEATVPLGNWPLYDAPNGYAPYGAAVDADGFVWTTAVFSDQVWRVDPVTLEVKMWQAGNGDSHYGMTVDSKGKVWFANWQGHGGVSTFDPVTETWSIVEGSTGNVFRGIAVDADGNVWTANNGGALGCGMIQVSADTKTVVTFHQFDPCGTPVGVSIDVAGKVWMVDYNGWAFKMDPQNYAKELVNIANVHYTYSDMTGGGLLNAVIPK
ncbi:MAG: lyase [Nannocystis sp.]|nr:lyase [Nannocystis sp.]MBA3545088.1 lyase [Nannocystis sp.]